MARAPVDLLAHTTTALTRLRQTTPLVQCITNNVVTNFTANTLLALGAAPAMVDIPGEAGDFASMAGGVLINLGTPYAEQRQAMIETAASARQTGTPWVLDPVAAGGPPVRTALARRLAAAAPTVIRGNASEILALAGTGGGGRGVESADDVEAAAPVARELADRTGAVVAVSGPVDLVTDGVDTVRLSNGDRLLTRITGGGCALGAVMAAFVCGDPDPLAATVAAVTVYCVAAEMAAERSRGPGGFAGFLLDELALIDTDDVRRRAVIA